MISEQLRLAGGHPALEEALEYFSLNLVVWQVKNVDKQPAPAKKATHKGTSAAKHEQVRHSPSGCTPRSQSIESLLYK